VPVEAAVDLVVARKPLVEVPNLLKLKQTDAEARLQESNLNLGAITEEVSKADPGTVIRQSPEAGASVEIGSAVDIVLARAESVSVPNIVGHKEGDALRLLKRARLSAGQKKTRQTSEGIGTILEQDPAPGTEVPPGSAINYVLGVAETSRVPDVVNLSVEKAKELIERARLVTGLVTTRQHPRLDNVVLNQDPDAGKEVPLHTAINLVVAKLWTLKEIGDKIAKHPDFDKIGVPLATLMARIASSQFNSPEKLQQVATFPDIQLVAELGLPNVRSATTLKRIIKSIFL
jgi:serine/threonine-protein kinase